jgi:predicted DNA binding protein
MDEKDTIKTKLLEEFRLNPVVQVAVKKVGTSRATYYRLRKDHKFAEEADAAIEEGVKMISDMAESQLISAIRDRNITSIIFWLKSRHPAYKERVELNGKLNLQNEKLTDAQESLILRALKLGFGKEVENDKKLK